VKTARAPWHLLGIVGVLLLMVLIAALVGLGGYPATRAGARRGFLDEDPGRLDHRQRRLAPGLGHPGETLIPAMLHFGQPLYQAGSPAPAASSVNGENGPPRHP
jgi:hypothetical protein